jgi:hypothetical protein
MKPVDDLESYLDRFRSNVESEGSFTVAVDKAQHKLEKFRLSNPWQYPVELVSAAVLGGATEFRVSERGNLVRFEFDGDHFSQAELENLEKFVHEGVAAKRLQRLAVALSAVESLTPSSVEFESVGIEGRVLLRLNGSDRSVQVSRLKGAPQGNSLKVQFQSAFVPKIQNHPSGDLALILKRCELAPLRLSLNGTDRNPPCHQFDMMWSLPCPNLVLKRPPVWAETERVVEREPSETNSFSAFFFFDSSCRSQFGLQIVLDGVRYIADRQYLGNDCLHCLVTAANIRTDLSHSHIVQNADFLRLMQALAETGQGLIAESCRSMSRSDFPTGWERAVKQALKFFLESKDSESIAALNHWFEEGKALERARLQRLEKAKQEQAKSLQDLRIQKTLDDPKVLDASLAETLEAEGRVEDAALLRQNLAIGFTRQLLQSEGSEAIELAQRTLELLDAFPLSTTWLNLMQDVTRLRPTLSPFQLALCQGDVKQAMAHLDGSDGPEIMAECLELLGDEASRRRAQELRIRALDLNPLNTFLRYLRLDILRQGLRGLTSLVLWLRVQVQASWAANEARQTSDWREMSSALRAVILGSPPRGKEAEVDLLRMKSDRNLDDDVLKFCEHRVVFAYLKFDQPEIAVGLIESIELQEQLSAVKDSLKEELVKLSPYLIGARD